MKYVLLFGLLFIGLSSFKPGKLKPVKIAKNITTSLPSDFGIMPDELIASRYPAQRKPIAAYTGFNGQIDLVVTEKPSTFSKKDLPLLQKFYKPAILSMYSEVAFIREEVSTINGREFLIFEFVSAVKDDEKKKHKLAPIRKYTIVQYTIENDKLLIFTFNCPAALKPEWQATANKMMRSVKIS
ncbi:hypothetical protein [Adhaeribacter pallidiroseus]|uniref:PsbP C-terminal domain-containing protein n=1 Tax=Adhaeribacter pallidiroseus TaxID=2072847 RepID=A0A369QJY4_9BACT|nr:hypothetical protein [Adhaeribacter pallidiroseus]RDC65243.1 hypothetical protein AHMF7616_03873 [Adhaeribacter pallidiroseus]